ncbi:glycoside hydrolase [Microvirga sp. KLBC 81]|uniref:glycoside hydrolase n=1 Tax=Microvirga sp. KLBC 81 TaxID=1862707 RepID=UPI000D50749E|nr:glycoside hydrolase [Microvirga sp. KLBC 81]PVE23728.1 glycoside hydrolase [Microvirga sp. KLBC 81]
MFRSFFLAGFEGSTGYNRHGQWFDQIVATGHDKTVDEDYRQLADLGLHGARETIRWPLVDLGDGRYDFSTVEPFVEAARRHEVEVIWDLFHYGYPQGLDLWSEEFPKRFADYCYAVGRYIGVRTDGTCAFTPVNEPSFMAYAGGEKGLFAPHVTGRGWDLKVTLTRAAIEGINALWAACPGARMINVDPLCRVASPVDRPDLEEEARDFNERLVFQSWDMLCGRLLPELGGSREHLDVVGINYYWTNQWEWGGPPREDGVIPPLTDDDPRRWSLSNLVRSVWDRYGGEVMITETSHIGDHRSQWLHEVAQEAEVLLREGVPLRGVCLYPILGMPEWHDPDTWTPMGLWDPVCHCDPCGKRLICGPMLEALRSVRHVDELHHALLAASNRAKPISRQMAAE